MLGYDKDWGQGFQPLRTWLFCRYLPPIGLGLSIVEASELSRQLSEMLLFGSGRALVLFPATSVCSRVDTTAIAWDGGATAPPTGGR